MRISDWSSDVCSSDLFICMAFHESAYQRFLVGKVLIERADADTSPLRHSSGGRSLISILDQNLSRCDQDGLNGGLRSFLPRQFSWICFRQSSAHSRFSECE